MAALDNQTKINPTTSFFGSGSQQTISTLNNLSTVSAQVGSFSTLYGADVFVSTIDADVVSANLIDTTFISATTIDIDGQLLTATPTELLLNGLPLATTSNLSSIADWALDPAISTVQMDDNWLVGAGNIQSLTATISSLYADEIVAINQTVISTLVVEYTVSSLFADFQDLQVSTLGCDQATIAEITMISGDGTSELLLNPAGLGGSIGFQQFYQISSPLFSTGTSMLFGSNGGFSLGAANGLLLDSGNGEIGVGDILISSSSNVYGMGHIEALNLNVSSINGAEFTQSSITVEVVGVSTLIADSIQGIGAEIREALVSTLQFNPSFDPSLDVNLGLGSLFGNLAGAATGVFGVLVGGAALGTGIAALTQGRQTRNINSNTFELINGTTQLQVSSLGAPFESVYRFVSSGDASEIFISTQTAAGYAVRSMSDPLNTISSPSTFVQSFGQWVPLPIIEPSTLTNPNPAFSTITLNQNAGARGGAPYLNSGSGISTFEIYNTDAPQYSASLRTNQVNFSYAGLTSNDYTRDVLLYVFDTGANTRLRVGASNFTPQNLAYVSDIPAQISSFQTASISTLTVQTLNGGTPFTTANPQPVNPNPLFSTMTINANNPANGAIIFAYDFPFTATQVTAGEIGIQEAQIKDADSNNTNAIIIVQNVAGQARTADFGASRVIVGFQGAGGLNSAEPTLSEIGGLLDVNPGLRTNQVRVNTISTNVIGCQEIDFVGISTVTFSTVATAGAQGQPAGRLVMGGNDLDLGQQDLFCQQIILGAGGSGNVSEILMYQPDNGNKRLNVQNADQTIRLTTSATGFIPGYLLDTQVNPPFFSTLNGVSTALMASFPSTTSGSLGAQVLSVIPPLVVAGNFLSLSTQNLAVNTPLVLFPEVTDFTAGGIGLSSSAIVIPSDGIYEFATSIQFSRPAGNGQADFWFRVNGVDVPNSASEIAMPSAGAGQTLGNVVFTKRLVTGDKLQLCVGTSDTGVSATFFQSTIAGAPFARPAVPSLILACKCLNY